MSFRLTYFNFKEGAAANVRLNPQISLRGVYHNGQKCRGTTEKEKWVHCCVLVELTMSFLYVFMASKQVP
jgi:hypothetical protein